LYALKSQLVEFTELNPETSVFGMYLTEVKGHCAKLHNPHAYFKFYFAVKGRLASCCLVKKIHFLRQNYHKKLRKEYSQMALRGTLDFVSWSVYLYLLPCGCARPETPKGRNLP